MKLLLDQNLSPKLLENLDRSYPESHHVQELALEKNEDNQLWFYAKENNYTILTKDADFNNLVAFYGFPPKVIWIKKGNSSTKQIKDLD